MSVGLVASELHFLQDSPLDLCLHGRATLTVDGVVRHDGECTVFGAALYALRSLAGGYPTQTSREPFFPCCANAIYTAGPGRDAVVFGCPFGDALAVEMHLTAVHLSMPQWEAQVSFSDWQRAVFGFADQVAAFYRSAPPRQTPDEIEASGWASVQAEWARRRRRPMLG